MRSMHPQDLQEQLSAVSDQLGQLCTSFEQLAEHLPNPGDIQKPDVHPGERDLVLVYDLQVISVDGTIIRKRGRQDFDEALADSSMADTVNTFHKILVTMVEAPLIQRLTRYLQETALKRTSGQPPVPRLESPTRESIMPQVTEDLFREPPTY